MADTYDDEVAELAYLASLTPTRRVSDKLTNPRVIADQRRGRWTSRKRAHDRVIEAKAAVTAVAAAAHALKRSRHLIKAANLLRIKLYLRKRHTEVAINSDIQRSLNDIIQCRSAGYWPVLDLELIDVRIMEHAANAHIRRGAFLAAYDTDEQSSRYREFVTIDDSRVEQHKYALGMIKTHWDSPYFHMASFGCAIDPRA